MEKHLSLNPLTITSSDETQQPSNSVRKCLDSIPLDLLIDIFSRVSAKSIARFRCVSKFWSYVLVLPDFTEFYLATSSARPRIFFVLTSKGKSFFYSSPLPRNLDEDSCLDTTRYHSSYPKSFPFEVCTMVRGLALLRRSGYAAICNPATGEFLALPKVIGDNQNYYFGYDPISKKFKVLCITHSFGKYYQIPNPNQVLTLEIGKPSWKRLDHKFRFLENHIIRGEVCINGVLYFAERVDSCSSGIVCFDVRSDKLDIINIVEEEILAEHPYYIRYLTLFNYKGKLGLYRENEKRVSVKEILVWVLEDVGNHKWSKHVYALSDSGENIVRGNNFVGMTCNGEMVWSTYHLSNPAHTPLSIFFYSLERKDFTRVNIDGFKEDHNTSVGTFLDYAEDVTINGTWSRHHQLAEEDNPATEKTRHE